MEDFFKFCGLLRISELYHNGTSFQWHGMIGCVEAMNLWSQISYHKFCNGFFPILHFHRLTYNDSSGCPFVLHFQTWIYKHHIGEVLVCRNGIFDKFHVWQINAPWLEEHFQKFQHIWCTGKSLSEALIFVSTNPQYDGRLSIELQIQYMKIQAQNMSRTCCLHKLFWL